ncbi:PREDICTED: 3'-N-debenzoyl-2'-deoxytaxol N-benzoyltransferase [Fragaria vesca subsp. vesca]|uniref:3'-N-debenzoyl-2'-deoxytaxol N-benzoyltransferase n=1 Tax=Fragaria vesca subsp. vesca TaxID=101020 RepID=UPI0002C2E939|nr:PREDICTED: 3'-N-debenzoyl-2'-deoxytaxol N-benzoyltransferase [Fragaria vesca subsp. vesca]
MQVQISDTTVFVPSKPPFSDDHVLPLTHLDNDPNLRVTFRYVRAYVTTHSSSSDPFHVISAALSAALVHYYPLAASLRRRRDNRLELFCSAGQGVPLIRASVESTLHSVSQLNDAETQLLEQLVPDPDPDQAMVNPCVLQVTVFKCGGYTLGAAVNHSLCDGMGATQFFNAMAELARGSGQISVQPILDRSGLLRPRDPPRVGAPVLHEFLSLDPKFSPYEHGKQLGPVLRECFEVKDESVEKFKTKLLKQSGLSFTTFEALGAYIWRAKVKSSEISMDETVTFAYALNVRKLVNPALPVGYWGNGCIAMYVKLSAKELMEKPMWEVADRIKKSKSKATDEYVRSFIDFQELHYDEGINAGKEVSGFTDWRHLQHSTVDFGWGGPVTVLPLSRNLLGSVEPCFFLPFSGSNGKKDGFKIMVNLRESAMPGFRKEMDMFSSQEFGLSFL